MIFSIPLGHWVELLINFLKEHFGGSFDFINTNFDHLMGLLTGLLLAVHPFILIALLVVLVWFLSKRNVALWSGVGLLLIYNLNLWEPAMETLALVICATFLALIVGLPVGVLTAWSDLVHRMTMPVLDFMQTMPPFVYLVPAVILLGIGRVPALLATVIFAMPPVIRLTGLGIRQVPVDFLEAAEAFGSTRTQKLLKVQLPLALPTIMAGVNQCIMLSLSMVVIAAMIGAGGLGGEVLRGLQRLDIPRGFEGGLAIVILAIILDRVTQTLGQKNTRKGN
ncbi:ABC transporter permease [Desulfofundulus thermocisternus]|uniref:ABC transporter permease n=1 Tax=Desulfofundulus thermocisternus TaxID=42471 RepID=UPI00217E901C|nr:proline/glycine betaine ABC transporter permease [Desulfofundulus thermocisternus]MCS5695889.1 proline/glycine betaine ABC transporter permease [Desulfofundulus thermocisternus]